MKYLKKLGALLLLASALAVAMHTSASAATQVGTYGTKDNPVIVKEYSAAEIGAGISERQGIGRGRSFKYTIDNDVAQVAFANRHRTRGWHLCFGMTAMNSKNMVIAEGVLKQGLREKGWRSRDRKVQIKQISFPSEMVKLRVQMWRCSKKDFGPELFEKIKQIGKLVASVKGMTKLYPVKLF